MCVDVFVFVFVCVCVCVCVCIKYTVRPAPIVATIVTLRAAVVVVVACRHFNGYFIARCGIGQDSSSGRCFGR
jgi:hypothetical protein